MSTQWDGQQGMLKKRTHLSIYNEAPTNKQIIKELSQSAICINLVIIVKDFNVITVININSLMWKVFLRPSKPIWPFYSQKTKESFWLILSVCLVITLSGTNCLWNERERERQKVKEREKE